MKIKELGHGLSGLSLQKEETRTEMADLIRSRTELQCALDDLRLAGERSQGKRLLFSNIVASYINLHIRQT